MYKKTILIDLDGVLNQYNGIYDEKLIPSLKDGASDFLSNLSKIFTVKIFSTRNKNLVEKWLSDNNIDSYIAGITNIKEPAYLIIDDRCIVFEGDYEKTLQQIKIFQVWYKKS